jgi:UDP-N-acetylmuramyl pentapeptide synthase
MYKFMRVLVVDMTHGGTVIASEFLKLPDHKVFAWDVYSTIDSHIQEDLEDKGLNFIEAKDIATLNSEIMKLDDLVLDPPLIVAPVHYNMESKSHITHHEAVQLLLKDKIKTPIIEVTGVKGKTSVVWMLKEIFKDSNPLVLSSLGVEVVENDKWKVLKQNISITPASIIEAWNIAEGHEIGICIFETSLGGTGLADVGILTNIVEDYPIADNSRVASDAKHQIFKSSIVTCDIDDFNHKYQEFRKKTNTFSNVCIEGVKCQSDLTASQIRFGFDETMINIDINGLKTLGNKILKGSMEINTFAPAPIHVNNVLAAICASLTLQVPEEKIVEGMKNFRGLKGRTSIKEYNGIRVIEEINPGLNVSAVKEALSMMKDMDDVTVIFGGKYGVTCEEIDEDSVSEILDQIEENIHLILIDELGSNVKNILKRNFRYSKDLDGAIKLAAENKCANILIIYRSNFSDVKKR